MKKKLLILGGTRISLQILYAAKEMDLLVYVADYNEDSPCKQYADKSFLISATDVDAIVDLIRKESIDGVLMGYADVLMPYYCEICHKSGLPCYLNDKAIRVTSNKDQFKEYCKLFNIPTVCEYSFDDVISGRAIFPLIIKPVDNSGARGIYICNSFDEFRDNYNKSLGFSRTKKVLIERLMTSSEATIFYYLHNGEVYLLGVADRWMYEQNKDILRLPVGYTFPSKNIARFIKCQNDDIIKMFKSLDMQEGMVFIQTFVENGEYIVYEMGYRLTGSIEHHLMEACYNFNHLKKIISFAVGDEVSLESLKTLDPERCNMANVTLLLKEGIIGRIDGMNYVTSLPCVVGTHISHLENESITSKNIGRLSQVGVRVLIKADNRDLLLSYMDEIKQSISVFDSDNRDMVIKEYNYKELCK